MRPVYTTSFSPVIWWIWSGSLSLIFVILIYHCNRLCMVEESDNTSINTYEVKYLGIFTWWMYISLRRGNLVQHFVTEACLEIEKYRQIQTLAKIGRKSKKNQNLKYITIPTTQTLHNSIWPNNQFINMTKSLNKIQWLLLRNKYHPAVNVTEFFWTYGWFKLSWDMYSEFFYVSKALAWILA